MSALYIQYLYIYTYNKTNNLVQLLITRYINNVLDLILFEISDRDSFLISSVNSSV